MNAPPPTRILLVNHADDPTAAAAVRSLLSATRFLRYDLVELTFRGQARTAGHTKLSGAVEHSNPDLMLLWLTGSNNDQVAKVILTQARDQSWPQPIIVVADFADADRVIELLKQGAADFLTLPLKATELIPRLWELTTQSRLPGLALTNLGARPGLGDIVGQNAGFVRLLRQVPRIARTDASVLITGETGTGKELLARAVHRLGPRSAKPFVAVNCGAIPTELIENELFGHEAGAYTSAGASSRGLVKEADRGTLFLDEIDSLPALAQVKLLRFLQDGQFRPLGSGHSCSADVRVIAASNADLAESIQTGRLRRDLYYRLNVIGLSLPSLRNRPEDIPLLACHFAVKCASRFESSARILSQQALQKLLAHDWPGNVRELENVIERAVALAERPVIGQADIVIEQASSVALDAGFQQTKAMVIKGFEREYLQRLLLRHGGNISRAAKAAGKNRRAFWELMRKHHLCAPHSATTGGGRPPTRTTR